MSEQDYLKESVISYWRLIKKNVLVSDIIDSMIVKRIISPDQWKDLKSHPVTEAIRTEQFLELLLSSKISDKFEVFLQSLHTDGYDSIAKDISNYVPNSPESQPIPNSRVMPSPDQGARSVSSRQTVEMNATVKEDGELKPNMMEDMLKELQMAKEQRMKMDERLEENENMIFQLKHDKGDDQIFREDTEHQIELLHEGLEETKIKLQDVCKRSVSEENMHVKEINKLKENICNLEAQKETAEVNLGRKKNELQLLQVRYGIKSNECEAQYAAIKQLQLENTRRANVDDDILILMDKIKENETQKVILIDVVHSLERSITTVKKNHDLVTERMRRSLATSNNKRIELEKKVVEEQKQIDLLEKCHSNLRKKMHLTKRSTHTMNNGKVGTNR